MHRTFRINSRRPRYLDFVIVLACAAPFAVFAIGAWHWETWRGGVGLGTAIVLTIAVVVGFWVDRVHAESATLTVGDGTMRMESDLPKWMGPHAGWSLHFEEIARVGVLERFAVVQVQKKGVTLMPIPIRIMDWIEDVPGATAPRSTRDFRQSSLWQALEQAGVTAAQPDSRAVAANFDLARHPATRNALAVMAVLAAYWAIDSLLAAEAWAEWALPYWIPHALVGAAGVGLGLFALLRARDPEPVPQPVAIALAMLLGVTTVLASWVGLVRVNQVAGGPLEEQPYVRNDKCDALLPVKQGLPPVEYTELARDYWCQFPKDKQHLVPVRQGLFGLYQVDLTRHTAAIRDFRRKAGK